MLIRTYLNALKSSCRLTLMVQSLMWAHILGQLMQTLDDPDDERDICWRIFQRRWPFRLRACTDRTIHPQYLHTVDYEIYHQPEFVLYWSCYSIAIFRFCLISIYPIPGFYYCLELLPCWRYRVVLCESFSLCWLHFHHHPVEVVGPNLQANMAWVGKAQTNFSSAHKWKHMNRKLWPKSCYCNLNETIFVITIAKKLEQIKKHWPLIWIRYFCNKIDFNLFFFLKLKKISTINC